MCMWSTGSPLLYFYGREYWIANRASLALATLADAREGKLRRENEALQQRLHQMQQQHEQAARCLVCAVLCCAVLCCAVPCRAVPCRAESCRAVPCCTLLCYAMLCCAVLCRAVPCCQVKSINYSRFCWLASVRTLVFGATTERGVSSLPVAGLWLTEVLSCRASKQNLVCT